ncbi:hypothetical protein BOW51_00750 [Solemya velesiana gill symbiont]|uniref:Uncharacterized protein n=1 Tax=Solemya velesiana gill symbiont TaxID=1918948 RepID=A0A1T2KXW5_9GAMM|nr:hypothetical protein BOW51_00750 [Solemya velesiana gill symbiont]
MEQDGASHDYSVTLFQEYINTGQEPDFITQIELHIAIKQLFMFIKKNELIQDEDLRDYWLPILKGISKNPP